LLLARQARAGVNPHRQPALTPVTRMRLENPGTGRSAVHAAAFRCQIPIGQFIPIATDQSGVAAMAIGALASLVVDIARVDVVQAGLQGDISGVLEGA